MDYVQKSERVIFGMIADGLAAAVGYGGVRRGALRSPGAATAAAEPTQAALPASSAADDRRLVDAVRVNTVALVCRIGATKRATLDACRTRKPAAQRIRADRGTSNANLKQCQRD
jgi:hypothetical protein